MAAAVVLGRAQVFVGLLEDMPRAENRVVLDPADPRRIRFEYAVTSELRRRRSAFRALITPAVRWQPDVLSQP